MKKALAWRVGLMVLLLSLLMVASAQQRTVTVWMLTDISAYFKTLAADFQKANPGVTVVVREFANEAYKTALQVGVASNQPPDIFFNWAGDDSFKFVRENQVVDLTAAARAAGWDKTLRGAVGGFSQAGKIWGAPFSQESKYFYYNKEVFAKENVKVPATFNELLATCRSLKAKGITPIAFGNSERWTGVHYLTIFNQKVVGEAQIEADYSLRPAADKLFTDPGYAEAFQKLKDMQSAGCFNDAVNSMSPEIARAVFYTGKSAMTYCGTWCLGIMDSNGFKDKYGNFRLPPIEGGKGNQDYVMAGPIGLQVSARSANREAALAFVSFAVSSKAQNSLLVDLKRIPIDPAATKDAKIEPALANLIADLGKAEGTALWLDTLLENSVAEAYLNAIQEVLNGTKTPQQAMASIREKALAAKQKLGR